MHKNKLLNTVAIALIAFSVVGFNSCTFHTHELEYGRSGSWSKVRAEYISQHPSCECCSSKKDLQVHHIVPYHIDPSKELDLDNLITLCHTCHFVFGHLMNFKSWNVDVREDTAKFRQKILNRPHGEKAELTD